MAGPGGERLLFPILCMVVSAERWGQAGALWASVFAGVRWRSRPLLCTRYLTSCETLQSVQQGLWMKFLLQLLQKTQTLLSSNTEWI